MKKLLVITLALMMLVAVASCSKKPADNPVGEQPAPEKVEENLNLTPAGKLLAEFKKLVKEDKNATTESIATKLSENEIFPFFVAPMPIQEGYLSGFSKDIVGFKDSHIIMPMIGSIPFVSYVFELEDGADVDAFVETLKDNANMRWLVCVTAEEIVCEKEGNLVFFCMAKTSFAE